MTVGVDKERKKNFLKDSGKICQTKCCSAFKSTRKGEKISNIFFSYTNMAAKFFILIRRD